MKVYKSPFVTYDCYFVAERPMKKYKNEASGTTGWCVRIDNGEVAEIWRASYYNESLKKMPIVGSIPSLKKLIASEVLKVVS